MRDFECTSELMMAMSRASEPDELVRLFFEHARRHLGVRRALVVSTAGLSPPHYRIVHDVWGAPGSGGAAGAGGASPEPRAGGVLAEIVRGGKFQNIVNFAPPAGDPASDLLRDARWLTAFPLFEKGASSGSVVLLGSTPHGHDAAHLCTLAVAGSLLGRAIEAQGLARRLEATCRALDAELASAADVQRWLLPSLPAVDGARLAASYRTARHSGGDYYDVGLSRDGRLGLLIADVSGKGAAAAVVMAILRSIVHEEVDRTQPLGPAGLLDYVDGRLRALGLPERGVFVTAFCGSLDPGTGTLTYCSAGHPPPRLLRLRDRVVVPLDGPGAYPLALLDEPVSHTENVVRLGPGDLALFYTDGITEARSPAGRFLGVERLDRSLRELSDPIAPEAAVAAVARRVVDFEAGGTPADDQTLLALCKVGGAVSRLSNGGRFETALNASDTAPSDVRAARSGRAADDNERVALRGRAS